MKKKLHHYFENAKQFSGESIYLKAGSVTFSYNQIFEMAMGFENMLIINGILANDRVIIYSSKNAASIAMMIACSRCNCIYVPISSINPAQRANYIINETTAKFVLCESDKISELSNAGFSGRLIHSVEKVNLFVLSTPKEMASVSEEAALILFTSGSTGTPKGVVISHTAAITFIDWISTEFLITGKDICASIAPFNFDLSLFDIFATAKMHATLLLYTEEECKNALLMAQNLSHDKATTIYATPTFYSTLANYGKLRRYDYSSLKNVLFAGEVFLLENFLSLLELWPDKNFANLYGPTETNVCTFYKININTINYPVFPIGKACNYATLILLDESGNEIKVNNLKGELLVGGTSLFNEYWSDPEKTTMSTYMNIDNKRYYRTGDIVYRNDEGNFVYVSRMDRMIKKNGYRIEPVEIENVIMALPNVSNVVVLFIKHFNHLVCFVESPDKSRLNFNDMKAACIKRLPLYMVPDKFVFLETMPKTTSGKIDLQSLEKLNK